ncbi:MAG: hypothetical protein Q7L55_02665 [Actinomycetota bacterium]|nr:hypothetical protein [Actinomycetota bacterium]
MRLHRVATSAIVALTALSTLLLTPVNAATSAFTTPGFPAGCNQPGGISPQMAASVMGLPLAVGAGAAPQTIVIAETNSAPQMASVNATMQACGLPAMNPTIVSDPAYPPGVGDSGGEADLDLVVMSGALPPNANLVVTNTGGSTAQMFILAATACGVVFSSEPAAGQWVPTATRGPNFPAGGCIISASYGNPESADTAVVNGQTVLTSQWQAASDMLADLQDLGIIVVTPAGDNGPGGCQKQGGGGSSTLTPVFPGSDPAVVNAGGTQWDSQAQSLGTGPFPKYQSGVPATPWVWNSASPLPNGAVDANCTNYVLNGVRSQPGATGGGVSAVFPMLAQQKTAATAAYPSLPQQRMIPDLAALAGWPFYAMYADAPGPNGQVQWNPSGGAGTSAATPAVAVGLANVNAYLSARKLPAITNIQGGGPMDVHSVIYNPAFAIAFNDVTQGTNNLFGFSMNGIPGWNAMPGFDMTSGMGVPNFATLATLLANSNKSAARAGQLVPKASSVTRLGGGVRVDSGTPSTPPQRLPLATTHATTAAPVTQSSTTMWIIPRAHVHPSSLYVTQLRIDDRWMRVGSGHSSAQGVLNLPTMIFDLPGKYPIRVRSKGLPDQYGTLAIRHRT